MKQKLFGTDGIRGTANRWPMTPDVVVKVGQAMGHILKQRGPEDHRKNLVVIGKDTRLSGYMLEQALSSGLNSMGVHVQLLGPLPTPGIGFLTQNMRARAGVVISASHNAFEDNGIKIFDHDGFKIPGSLEEEIERLVFECDLNALLPTSHEIGRSKRIDDAAGRYIVHVKNVFPLQYSLEGVRVVLDCANGASYKVAPAIFEELGAEVVVLGREPNGTNINDKVGALYPHKVAEAVKTYRADVGISVDGDADRLILVDETGAIVNGDHIIAICALHMKQKKKLPNDTVVTTQMSNFGLRKILSQHGIKMVQTKVGDKHVVEEMKKRGAVLGGEQSGHIIFLEHSTTGDGLVAALNVLAVMKETGQKLSDLKKVMTEVPQVLVNVRVKQRCDLDGIKGYKQFMTDINSRFKDNGRAFVRFSGTEPVLRILVEGPNRLELNQTAEEIASFLQKELVC